MEKTSTLSLALSKFMSRIYGWMTFGLLITAVTGYVISSNPNLVRVVLTGPTMMILVMATLGLVLALSLGVRKMSVGTATACFLLYSFLNGATFSAIFLAYSLNSIAQVFAITAGTFGGLALYGYMTKRDLTAVGTFMMMGVWGILIASLINMFTRSSGLDFMISLAAVVIFSGLTAYDVQKLKSYGASIDVDSDEGQKMAVIGALQLYLDFINLFLALLRLFGSRNRD
jgi:FtsH-binding integral membrane protein